MIPTVAFKNRETVPTWFAYGTPLLTVIAALLVSAIPLIWLGVNPINSYYEIFVSNPTGVRGLSYILVTAVPLFLAGLAVYVPLKAGLWNIGAEGQLFVGAIIGSYLALNFEWPIYVLLPTMIVAAGIAGALFGAIPGYLRAEHNVNEIISSLMLTFTATTFTGYLLRGPMQGAGGQSATERLPDFARIPTVIHPRLHIGVGLIIVIAVLVYLLINRTRLGYEITLIGSNPSAAAQAGISEYRTYITVFVLGGFLAGIAGIIEIAGVHGRLFEGFSPDYGFTAIAVALLGRNGVFRVLLAALFFAVITTGGTTIAVTQNVPTAIINVIVALTILFLLTAEFIKEHRIVINPERESDADTPSGLEGAS